jgi:hypothetical protein
MATPPYPPSPPKLKTAANGLRRRKKLFNKLPLGFVRELITQPLPADLKLSVTLVKIETQPSRVTAVQKES